MEAEGGRWLAINGVVCERYPRVASAALDLDWAYMGHGYAASL